jgi:hypothetical protein
LLWLWLLLRQKLLLGLLLLVLLMPQISQQRRIELTTTDCTELTTTDCTELTTTDCTELTTTDCTELTTTELWVLLLRVKVPRLLLLHPLQLLALVWRQPERIKRQPLPIGGVAHRKRNEPCCAQAGTLDPVGCRSLPQRLILAESSRCLQGSRKRCRLLKQAVESSLVGDDDGVHCRCCCCCSCC